MKKYKVAFIGATAFACGYAHSNEDAVIIEENIVFAPEFTLSYAKNTVSVPLLDFTKSFYEIISKKGLLINDKIHLMPVADVLAELMLGKNVYLDSNIINIEKDKGLYKINIWSQGGLNIIYAEHIIDTTEKGYNNIGENNIKCQYMCGALNKSIDINDEEKSFYIKGALKDEMYFICNVPVNSEYQQARKVFYEEWKKNNSGLMLVSEGQKMIYEYENNINTEIAENFKWIPSMQFKDIICALEEGYKCSF